MHLASFPPQKMAVLQIRELGLSEVQSLVRGQIINRW